MKKKLKRVIYMVLALFVLVTSFSVSTQEVSAAKIKYTITWSWKIKKVKKKPCFSAKSDWIYTQQGYEAELLHTNNKGIKWSVSNKKILKITSRRRNTVSVVGLRAGTAWIKAKYKGKTYKMKLTVKGRDADAVKIGTNEIYFEPGAQSEMVSVTMPNVGRYQEVSFNVENPDICQAEWDQDDWYDAESGESYTYLYVYPENVGTTRIAITNLYNPKEVDYINVTVPEYNYSNFYWDY